MFADNENDRLRRNLSSRFWDTTLAARLRVWRPARIGPSVTHNPRRALALRGTAAQIAQAERMIREAGQP